MRGWCACLLLLCCVASHAQLLELERGHLKGQYLLGTYPDDSLLGDYVGSPTHDLNTDLRLLFDGRKGNWSWQGDYQFILRSGDTVDSGRQLTAGSPAPDAVPNDSNRLLDLTHVIAADDDRILVQRLDRLYVTYSGDAIVARVGRQVLSWGNGLMYNVVDFFNPFDPAAVDKEYKPGEDMVYGQYLQGNGDDWQFVSVWRRDPNGNTGSNVNTSALKFHSFVGEQELDLLVARHFDDTLASAGGLSSWGGAIVRADLLMTDTDTDTYISAVANLSYSWVWGAKNVSGILEYFHNGLGLRERQYGDLAAHPDLADRLARGELFTIGRDYLAGGLTIQLTPLFKLTPNLFVNLGDGSGLAQLVGEYDVKQNWQILWALNLPVGGNGTEFGGLDSGVQGKQLSSGVSLFSQLAFYF